MCLILSIKKKAKCRLNYKIFGDIGEDVIVSFMVVESLDNWQTIMKQLSDVYKSGYWIREIMVVHLIQRI